MWTVTRQMVHAGIEMWTGAIRVLQQHQLLLLLLCRGMNHQHGPKQRLGDPQVRDLYLDVLN
jgi:hypothetical protein